MPCPYWTRAAIVAQRMPRQQRTGDGQFVFVSHTLKVSHFHDSDVTSQRNLTSQGEFWTQRAVDNIWLGIFVLTNAGLFIWRFLAFPLDPVIGYWPAIAKASAALALLNILLVLLAVCYRLVGRINLCLRRHCRAFRLLPPLYKPIVFHKIAGTAAVGAATLHSLSWIVILGRVRACQDDKDGGKSTHYQRLQFVGHSASATNLLSETPIWTGAVMALCMLVALPFCIQPLRELSFKSFALTHLAFAPMVLLTLVRWSEWRFQSFVTDYLCYDSCRSMASNAG